MLKDIAIQKNVMYALKLNVRGKKKFFFIFFTIKKCVFSNKRKLDRCIFKDVSKWSTS